jgi:hypothetical protein
MATTHHRALAACVAALLSLVLLVPASARAQAGVAAQGEVQVGAPPVLTPSAPPPQLEAPAPPAYQPAQVVVVQQPPPQPYYVVAPQGRVRGQTVPYEGGPIPPGATLRYRSNRGMIIAGSVMLGVGWVVSAASALVGDMVCLVGSCSNWDFNWLYIPVVGPILAGLAPGLDGPAVAMLAIDAALQIGGLALLIAGAVSRQPVLTYDVYGHRDAPGNARRAALARPRWTFLPFVPGAPAGASVALTGF